MQTLKLGLHHADKQWIYEEYTRLQIDDSVRGVWRSSCKRWKSSRQLRGTLVDEQTYSGA